MRTTVRCAFIFFLYFSNVFLESCRHAIEKHVEMHTQTKDLMTKAAGYRLDVPFFQIHICNEV